MATGDHPLFVYGTLRSESDHEFARLLREASEFVSVGRLRGSLYRIAHYPAWVEEFGRGRTSCVSGPLPPVAAPSLSPNPELSRDRRERSAADSLPNRWVTGEIWRPRDSASLLETLDRYEGPEYNRVMRTIETSHGPLDCWAYLYAASIQGKERIISGNWLA